MGSICMGDCCLVIVAGIKSVLAKKLDDYSVARFVFDYLRALQDMLSDGPLPSEPPVAKAPSELCARMGFVSVLCLAQVALGVATDLADDARALWNAYDDVDERVRGWYHVCRDIKACSCADCWASQHDGVACVEDLFRSWPRQGIDPLVWLNTFLSQADINPNDRIAIASNALSRNLLLSGLYDHMHGPSLARNEELRHRVAQLIEGYDRGHGGCPIWPGVKHVFAVETDGSRVPSQLCSFAHRKVKEDVDMENIRRRVSNHLPAAADAAEHLGNADGGLAKPRRPAANKSGCRTPAPRAVDQ